MARARANGIELEYEIIGRSEDPTLLLIAGTGAQLIQWQRAFGLHRRGDTIMTVPIKIIQTEQGYIAQLTPPAVSIVTPVITERWETAQPITREALRAKLLELGAHPHDIEDAFAYSDPNWTPPVSDPAGSRRRFGGRRPPGYSNPEG